MASARDGESVAGARGRDAPEGGAIAEKGGIVVGVDGSRLSYSAFDAAVRLRRPGEFLTVLHIVKQRVPGQEVKVTYEGAEFIKSEFRQRGQINSIPEDEYKVEIVECQAGETVNLAICRALNDLRADLFISGAFGRDGPSPFGAGNKTDLSLRKCNCSTLIVKPETRIPTVRQGMRFLAAVDGAEAKTAAIIDQVVSRMLPQDKIIVFHICVTEGSEEAALPAAVQDAVKKLEKLNESGQKFEYELVHKPNEERKTLAQQISQAAEKFGAQLMVLGVEQLDSRSTKKSVLGAVTGSVVKKARTSVLLFK